MFYGEEGRRPILFCKYTITYINKYTSNRFKEGTLLQICLLEDSIVSCDQIIVKVLFGEGLHLHSRRFEGHVVYYP
jgi:hypothetical protein